MYDSTYVEPDEFHRQIAQMFKSKAFSKPYKIEAKAKLTLELLPKDGLISKMTVVDLREFNE